MSSFPVIAVREFDGRDTSYRVAARRARNYWELLANIHNIFSKPWERYNAHLHFDDHACHDRLSPSEWDAGGYFEPEFMVNGRMVLYAHFEQMDPVPASKMDASGCYETKQEDKLWYWGTYGDTGIRTKRKYTEDVEENFMRLDQNSHSPFPDELPHQSLIVDPIVKQTRTSKSAPLLPVDTHEVTTIHDSDSRRLLETGVVIGRALPKCCLDPNIRPVARAVINKVGSLIAYIPGKYSKRNLTKGDAQIAMVDIEFTPELEKYPFGEERSQAIRAMIERRKAPGKRDTTTASNDSQNQRLRNEGIIIGRAKGHCCRIPHMRPVVRAILNSKNVVMAYVPAQHIKHTRRFGEVQIALEDVDFSKPLVELPPWKISEAIRMKIETQMEEIENQAAVYDREPSTRMDCEADQEREEDPMEAPRTTDGRGSDFLRYN